MVSKLSQSKLKILQDLLVERIDDLLIELEVPLSKNSKYYYGCCPVHNGDNINAINLYTKGDYVKGYWTCYTHSCQSVFKKNILGFIRGVLSAKQGWSKKGDMICSWSELINFCLSFLKIKIEDIKEDDELNDKNNFVKTVGFISKNFNEQKKLLKKEDIRKYLKVPSAYFMSRGIKEDVLDLFDIGDYTYQGKPLSNRAVAPIYDENNRYVIGFTGRWIGNHQKDNVPKWYNHLFQRDKVLYNWWFAKNYKSLIIVEGPGEIWKLRSFGISNAVALLGKTMSDYQNIMLERSGVTDIKICLNNDFAGQEGAKKILQQLYRSFRVKNIVPVHNDIMDSDTQWIMENLS